MNGEGRQSDEGRGAERDDNVVRLTDWLGPREELVPFGPSAEGPGASGAADSPPSAADSPPSAADSPPSAADFWGEDSAAVQDALLTPPQDVTGAAPRDAWEGPSGNVRRPPRSRASAAAMWSRRRALLLGAQKPPVVIGRRVWPAAAASALAAGLLATILLTGLGSGPHATRPLSAQTPGGRAAAGDLVLRQPDRHLGAEHGATRRSSARRTARPARRADRATRRRRGVPADVVSVQPVGYTTPAATSHSSAPAQPAAPYQPTGPSYTTTSSTPQAAASAAGQSRGAGSQPALGANGSLAPGSSPDG